jgi:hypothetical protein
MPGRISHMAYRVWDRRSDDMPQAISHMRREAVQPTIVRPPLTLST